MSHRDDDLAYGDFPQRWDRDRFERLSGGGPSRRYEEEDTYRFAERDRPGRRDITITERERSRGPRGSVDEQIRFVERDREGPARPRRRTDRELFGNVDPREIADMALTTYKAPRETRAEIDIEPRVRPGLIRRQSSLDTFDRRPIPRYEREEFRVPVYTPVPVPYREIDRYIERDDRRYRDDVSEDYREVEIRRERSTHRRKPKSTKSSTTKSSKSRRSESVSSSSSSNSGNSSDTIEAAKSQKSGRARSSASKSVRSSAAKSRSVHESVHESISEHDARGSFHESIAESIHETAKKFKKGKTRMPKRLVRREAIMDLGYPFDEEEHFFVLRIALEKEQIDEVIQITESYNSGEKKLVYRLEAPVPEHEREEVIRSEWINPPSDIGRPRASSHSTAAPSIRRMSPGGHSGTTRQGGRSRATSREHIVEERRTVIEERGLPPPPIMPLGLGPEIYQEKQTTIVEERAPTRARSYSNLGALVLQEREYRSDRDIQGEIRALEAERRSLRLEREADDRRGKAVRIRDNYGDELKALEITESRPREIIETGPQKYVEIVGRDVAPPLLRVEKDRKGRKELIMRPII